MCIPVDESIGLEAHPDTDQFLRVETGRGKAVMGSAKKQLDCPISGGDHPTRSNRFDCQGASTTGRM